MCGPRRPWENLLILVARRRVDSGPMPRGDRSLLQVCKTALGTPGPRVLPHSLPVCRGQVGFVGMLPKRCPVSPHSLV